MTAWDIEQFAQAYGWKYMGGIAYGFWNGYPISLHYKANGAARARFSVAEQPGADVRPEKLSQALGEHCRVTRGRGCVNLLVEEVIQDRGDLLVHGLNGLTHALDEGGAAPMDLCPICGRPGCDSAVGWKTYRLAHQSCVTEYSKREEKERGNQWYLAGFLGAFAASLAGTILALLASSFGLLLLLPIYLAFSGYGWAKGKMTWRAPILTALAILLGYFAVDMIALQLAGVGIPASFREFSLQLDELQVTGAWFQLFFVLMGFAYSYRMVGISMRDRRQKQQDMMASLVPCVPPRAAVHHS